MLKRENRLRDRQAISVVFKERPAKTRLLLIYKKRVAPPPQLLVITSAKKIPLSTRRNRLRRRLHEIFREIMPTLDPDTRVIVVPQADSAAASYEELKSELAHALTQ